MLNTGEKPPPESKRDAIVEKWMKFSVNKMWCMHSKSIPKRKSILMEFIEVYSILNWLASVLLRVHHLNGKVSYETIN